MKNKIIPLICSVMLISGCSTVNQKQEAPRLNDEPNNVIKSIDSEIVPPSLESVDEPSISFDLDLEEEMMEKPALAINPLYTPGYIEIDPLDLTVRTSEATITDSGRINQKMDIVYLDYDYPALEELGYIYLDIKISFEAREIFDGYQYLFLYNSSKCQSSLESFAENIIPCVGDDLEEGLLVKEQFEIGPRERKTTWEEVNFHYVISTKNMIDDLYIRYGASGILEDTWVNRNVRVTVQPKQSKN